MPTPDQSSSSDLFTVVATCPRGFEDLLSHELTAYGAQALSPTRAAIQFKADLETILRTCLWSRIANRVLLPLGSGDAADTDALYALACGLPWPDLFAYHSLFAVDVSLRQSSINHSRFAAQRVKDAIVDKFRDQNQPRPSVDVRNADIRVNVFVDKQQATISLDLSGRSLHLRGYRERNVTAPLKENVAAALLQRMNWPAIAADGGAFFDPMCGSGTLLIEAAWMAADIAPGRLNDRWGFEHWLEHRPALWNQLLDEAEERREAGLKKLPQIIGRDIDPQAARASNANVRAAGLAKHITIQPGAIQDCNPEHLQLPETGLLMANPPYGERLNAAENLLPVYQSLGKQAAEHFSGWHLGVLTSEEPLARAIGLRANKTWKVDNGPLECELYRFPLDDNEFRKQEPPVDLLNRLQKNHRKLSKWASREDITCWRLYDADLPEYASAIDLYRSEDGQLHAHVQEYAAPKSVPEETARQRFQATLLATQHCLDIPASQVHGKVRQRQRGKQQYEKQAETGNQLIVQEGAVFAEVNLDDYLDTGLFLDHRPTRQKIATLAAGKKFLNLFCYTGVATLHAIAGGASSTTSLDLSNTYLDWLKRNIELNDFDASNHRVERADVTEWLEDAVRNRREYDLIFCDPPSFSNSSRMEADFDVQRDHVRLIKSCAALLGENGLLIFSCNLRRFKLDAELETLLDIRDVSQRSIPQDFARRKGIHHCWEIRRR